MIKKITINGLRAIKDLTIEDFQKVNLFVGKNNCGKSTVLEALFLSISPTNSELPLKINLFRGLKIIDENSWRVLFNKAVTDNSDIAISSEWSDPYERRSLVIKPGIRSICYDSLKTADSLKTTIDKDAVDIKDSYSGLSSHIDGLVLEYSFFTRKKQKTPKNILSKITMDSSGIKIETPQDYKEYRQGVFINSRTLFGDISKRFDNVQVRKQTDRIIKILNRIEPSLKDILLGKNEILYCDIGLDRLIPINVLGDGILRMLSIIMAISDTANGAVFIDEIENGFHYSSQEILWNAIFEAAREFNVQIFATTHSEECIKAFSSSYSKLFQDDNDDDIRLYRIERKDDNFRIVSYNNKTLAASLESGWEVR